MLASSRCSCALISLALGLTCAAVPRTTAAEAQAPAGTWHRDIAITGKVGGVSGAGKVNVFLPAGYSTSRKPPFKLLVALHGWRGRAGDWERNSPLSFHASKHSYVIVAPSMGSTVYERRFFPETSAQHKWGAIPGGRWVGEVVVPTIRRRYNVSKARSGTGVFGLSTGGRGTALLPAYYPQTFGAFAALSADYDITMAPKDKTCTAVYGAFHRFPERWRGDSSKVLLDRLKGTPALLIHGTRDKVCPVEQSRLFARDMKRKGYDVRLVEEQNLGHDWKLWRGHLGEVFAFFDEKLRAH